MAKLEMTRQKILIPLLSSFFIVSVFYRCINYNNYYRVNNFIELKNKAEVKRKELVVYNGLEDYLINTTGCYIPNYGRTYNIVETKPSPKVCGHRAIFLKRMDKDEIIFIVDDKLMNKYHNKYKFKYQCCYRVIERSDRANREDMEISYSDCLWFRNGTQVSHKDEYFTVSCSRAPPFNKPSIIYEDAYLILNKHKTRRKSNKWNVLLVGVDTMSRARLLKSMPETAKYLQSHGWLDYKGYQKVDSNTFPNIMALLTGKTVQNVYKACSAGMSSCNKHILWSKFREAGYTTAYGEDNLKLPDTFNRYNGFESIPTDHYTKPFFLIGENKIGNYICMKQLPSPTHILNYAYDFVDAYKSDNFFGMFWINSYSHNPEYVPKLHDSEIVDFFERIRITGAMNNTFVIFFSDHGIRFGRLRNEAESYYGERLPMLYIWTPTEFRQHFQDEYYNLQLNQNRLVTPYDLHLTLTNILNSSDTAKTEACPLCRSLFHEIPDNRTCSDAKVTNKWCTCHVMETVNVTDPAANASLKLAVSRVQNISQTVNTKHCMKCAMLHLKNVLRIHKYMDENSNIIYVVAFEVVPANIVYEVNILKNGDNYTVDGNVYTISTFNSRGGCVINRYDWAYCVCVKDVDKCPNTSKH